MWLGVLVAAVPSDGGAPRSSATDCLLPPCVQVFGARRCGLPSPDLADGGSGCGKVEGAAFVDHGVWLDGARWRLHGVRGPVASRPLGDTSDPRFGRCSGGALPERLVRVDEDGIQEGLECNFADRKSVV